jgi:hypothetical protein
MIVLFIVIANEVLKCYGVRFCEPGSALELTRLWQIGLVEITFEGTVGGVAVKVWRRVRDKISIDKATERSDKIV